MKTQAYFEDIYDHLQSELQSAKHSVKLCVAWLNWEKYRRVLENLLERGVRIELIHNDDNANTHTLRDIAASIQLFPIRGRWKSDLMHHKFCIVDDRTVVTGSFNWSRNAPRHFENIVVVKDDFRLVKSFLHEFEDLKAYFHDFNSQQKMICGAEQFRGAKCASEAYSLGVLGQESGMYDDSEIGVYSVCVNHRHIQPVTSMYDQYLLTQLGLKDENHFDNEEDYTQWQMSSDFNKERQVIGNFQSYFAGRHQGLRIHAVGAVRLGNELAHLKYQEPPEHEVVVLWRDTYYRKVVPEVLYDEGNLDLIVDRHY